MSRVPPQLLAYLATISDPRGRRGRRHPLAAILAIAAAAVLVGARSMAAIAERLRMPRSWSGWRLAAAVMRPPTGSCPPRPPSAARWPAWTPRPWPR
jgi:hypothetical protein